MEHSLEYEQANDKSTEMSTLSSVAAKVVKNGYIENFKITEDGKLANADDKEYGADEVKVVDFFRFEGESDPADNSILYIIETKDGLKGTLVDAYGAYADHHINDFMDKVEGVHKKKGGL